MTIKWVRMRTEHGTGLSRSKASIVAIFLGLALVGAPGTRAAFAALPAPSWMPGFPIMAGNQVILMWSPVPGAAKYHIYLNGEKVSESVAFQLTIPTPEKSGEYQVTVSAIDGSGAEGPQSTAGTIKIISLEPPPKLYTIVSRDSIGIRWDKAESAVIYNVYRAESAKGEKKLIGSVQDTIFRDTDIEVGKQYSYFVTSKDVSGKESGFSDVVSARIEEVKAIAKAETYDLVPIRAEYQVIKPAQELKSPSDMVFSGGRIYLVDNALRKVFIFDDNAELVGSFGKEGYLDGQFMSPRGIDIQDGKIAISDMTREMILIFSGNGVFESEFEIPKGEKLARPSYLAFTPQGTLLIVDGANFRIVEMDLSGKMVAEFGEKNTTPFFNLGTFGSPSFINVDKEGRAFIVDKSYGKIHVFGPDHKPLFAIGLDKGVGSFVDGGKMAFDYERRVVFVSDPMLASIQAFGLNDGKYRFSLFDRDKTIIQEYVPKWEIGSPRVLEIDDRDNLWVIMGLNRALAKVTKLLDPVPGEKTK